MAKWSREQNAILEQWCNHGPEKCAEVIRERFGVKHSPEAVRKHANRIGIPMVRYEPCPRCGRAVKHLTEYGICLACHQRELANGQKEYRRILLREIEGECDDIKEAKRSHARIRKANSRLAKKYNVGRKERGYGDIAKCP